MTLKEQRPRKPAGQHPENTLLLLNTPDELDRKNSKTVYTFSSSPRALYTNRKMIISQTFSDGIYPRITKTFFTCMTDIIMPPVVVSMSSDEVDDDVAFKVLNKDNLPVVVGEAILPFGRDNQQKQKPNLIVYPTRRQDTNLDENKQFTKSHDHINHTSEAGKQNLRKNFSISHGQLNHTNSASKSRPEDIQNQLDTKFTKALDLKLKKLLKKQGKIRIETPKKPFVTTVKKGQFLEPPPEIASLIGLRIEELPVKKEQKKIIYAYSSEPRVLNRAPAKNAHKSRCEAAARAAATISGSVIGFQSSEDVAKDVDVRSNKKWLDVPLPYANLMFDRRVARGSNFAPTNLGHLGDGESAAARAAEARRRAMARRKARNQQQKAAQLRLGSPPPVHGRKHIPVQTDTYLEELYSSTPVEDVCTQTDLFLERPVSPLYIPVKSGIDAETQIYPGDLFDFDMEVQPILEVLVGKTVEQALIEVLEEEELAALREQQRRFLELRAAETSEAQRIQEREKRLTGEKELRMKEHEEGLRLQKEMEERIAAAVLMQGYMADLLPSVLEGLEAEGYLIDCIKQDVNESFMPWLMREVTHELQDMVSSRDVLTDMVKEILDTRAEIYNALNQEQEPESEEEGPTHDDMMLEDHLRLQEEITAAIKREKDKKSEEQIAEK